MIKTLAVAARDRARLKEILQIASRFGVGVLLSRMGLESSAQEPERDPLTLPERTRLALEALGPTFVKLGQILATRADLLSPEWISELEKLHSRAPTLPFEVLRGAVEEALGAPPEMVFARFDVEPLAAASMAQVHRACLPDGREVVLKIRRPGIRPRIEADLRLIAQLASVAETANGEVRRFAPSAMMRQLAEAVLEELDFTAEGRNADRLRADFADNPQVVIPEIHWAWTSETLLVMDHVAGIHPRSEGALRDAGIDPEAIAMLGADIVLDMVLVNGRFHGDPHPGNLLCLPGNRIALLDLGMIGHVSPRRREEFTRFVQSLALGDPAQLADILFVWAEGEGVTRARLLPIAERLIARHGGGAPLVLTKMVADFLMLMRVERLTMPPDLLLTFKALITLDGVLATIHPGFDLSRAIRRSSLKIARARISPEHWAPVLQALALEAGRIGEDAPRLLRAAIRRLEDPPASDKSVALESDALRMAARWIASAVFASSLVIAAALVLN